MNKSFHYINKCQRMLKMLNLIESNYQFSTQFLNKSKHYYALCQTGREPSINSIYNLVNNINQLNETIFNNNPLVDKLIDEGKQIIDDRIIQWYN
ncbi:MAG: hypothetical protein IJO11_01760 [Alphaproteobacteria bacterium]|nr:hypothetical protein [Alphaproteobacteria bacterium]